MRLGWAVCFLATVAAAVPAVAQPPSSPPKAPQQSEIVVVGQRLKDRLQSFVNSVAQAGPTNQLARWDREICPQVVGIDTAQAAFMTQRIAQIAKTVGIRSGRGRCATLLQIVFTHDAAPLAQAIAGGFPTDNWHIRNLLGEFAGQGRPVRWISLTDECGKGCELPNTRLSKATRPTLRAMIVIVDANQVAGFSIGALSDYVGLVALSNPSLSSEPPGNSILSLFKAPRSVEGDTLTAFDYSFLAGLYRGRDELDADAQRAAIVRRMNRDLGKRPEQPAAVPQN